MVPPPESMAEIDTTWGAIRIRAAAGRVVACALPVLARRPAVELHVGKRTRIRAGSGDRLVLEHSIRFVRAVLAGRAAACPPLSDQGTPFMRRVRCALRKVKRGRTCSYAGLAAAAGSPAAARAAGQACASNPLPLFIPCHRVLAAGGKLGGFSGGLAWKQELLRREGVVLAGSQGAS